jgi:hypothetical protein
MLSTEGGVGAMADIVGRSRIVVLVPCYNEEAAIGKVVTDFRAALPELELPIGELRTPYYPRPDCSSSKLSTWRDGFRILRTVMRLYRSERPLALFTGIDLSLAGLSIGIAIPLFMTYLETGLVPRFPTAILATGLMVLAVLSVFGGLILDTVTRGRRELKLLAYLAQRAPGE